MAVRSSRDLRPSRPSQTSGAPSLMAATMFSAELANGGSISGGATDSSLKNHLT